MSLLTGRSRFSHSIATSPTPELHIRCSDAVAASFLVSQLRNPYEILPLLLLVGSEVVHKALAQATGNGFPPVCFSFGWVSYAFVCFANLLGDGRLMPHAEFPCKVYNMESGYPRENRNWVISRLLRDNELFMAKQREDRPDLGNALRIAIYEPSPLKPPQSPGRNSHYLTSLAQFAIAITPWILSGDRLVFLITVVGTLMVVVTGILPQWRAEKLPEEKKNRKTFAVTVGNGSKDIMIIRNLGLSYDLEDLSTFESPRLRRAWQQCGIYKKGPNGNVRTFNGLPLDFWLTRVSCFCLVVGWLLLLLLVAGMQSNSWYLFVIATLGMIQNSYVAGKSLHPETQLIPLILTDQILGNKVMDALMDLEVTLERDPLFGEVDREAIVEPLLKEYFPGSLRKDYGEKDWWDGDRDQYDSHRLKGEPNGGAWTGLPRSRWFVVDPKSEKTDLVNISYTEMAEEQDDYELHDEVPGLPRTRVGEIEQSSQS